MKEEPLQERENPLFNKQKRRKGESRSFLRKERKSLSICIKRRDLGGGEEKGRTRTSRPIEEREKFHILLPT